MTRAGARPGDITIETSDGIAVGDTVRISDEWLGELRRGVSPEYADRFRGTARVVAIHANPRALWVSAELAWNGDEARPFGATYQDPRDLVKVEAQP